MANHYKHIHAALRAALIDRDLDGDNLNAGHAVPVKVTIGSKAFMLHREIPSAALLTAYSMLYYPSFIEDSIENPFKAAILSNWLGGVNNPHFPLFPNEQLAEIAVAVGCYAGLFHAQEGVIISQMVIRPNLGHPIVQRTHELITENKLTFKDARDVFIELMQDEKYARGILLADDYVANASFITEATIAPESKIEELREATERALKEEE